ncbi:MAG: PEP-CTERM sorting domain-containing protein [Planctomycetes bacterium]|nr:PEP-CTERM sorting domain-containing protein [Planctomycetota bacterium]
MGGGSLPRRPLTLREAVGGYDSTTTELVLDDIIVNAVPEPVSLALMASSGLIVLRGRRRYRA